MTSPSEIGNQTMGVVLAAMVKAGYRPLIPFGDGHRYDLAFDHQGKIFRVQCKTGRLVKGVVRYRARTTLRNGSHRVYQEGEDLLTARWSTSVSNGGGRASLDY